MTDAAVSEPRRTLCALLTCFNRREKTLACLARLQVSGQHLALDLKAVLVDDGSKDGTAEAVRSRFPWVRVLPAKGDLYWCRAMHRAYAEALKQGADFYLWLNDDTMLESDALSRLLACHDTLVAQAGGALLVIGSVRDPDGGNLTYGGENRVSHWRPTRFAKVSPGAAPQRVDTFDGNIVLVNAEAAQRVGNLDPAYEHAMGDLDYGLRAGRAGVVNWLAPGWFGTCSHNPLSNTYMDSTLPWRRRWQLMLQRKGLPVRSWWHFNRQHSGWLWPVAFAWPYTRMLMLAARVSREPLRADGPA